jgi:hypothetical protein
MKMYQIVHDERELVPVAFVFAIGPQDKPNLSQICSGFDVSKVLLDTQRKHGQKMVLRCPPLSFPAAERQDVPSYAKRIILPNLAKRIALECKRMLHSQRCDAWFAINGECAESTIVAAARTLRIPAIDAKYIGPYKLMKEKLEARDFERDELFQNLRRHMKRSAGATS